MITKELIAVNQLCTIHSVHQSFFVELDEIGLIEIKTIESTLYIHQDALVDVEKMIRLQQDLNLTPESIDVVFNLLQQVKGLQEEVNQLQNRLNLYEQPN